VTTDKKVDGVTLVLVDIDGLKRTEAALKKLNDKQTEELKATGELHQTSTLLIQENEPQALFEQTLNAALAIMHAEMASLQMVDENEDALRLLASRGFGSDYDENFKWVRPGAQTACALARAESRRVIISDVETTDWLTGTSALKDLRRSDIRATQSTPLMSRDGRVIGVLSTHWRSPYEPPESELRLMDILARQAADLIERSRTEEALKEANRRKGEFLAVLAHELRTPLSPIRNSLEIMKLQGVSPGIAGATEMMGRQIGHMVRLVEDLLDVSRIDRGKIELRISRVELASVMHQVVEASSPNLKKKEITLTVTLPEKPIYLSADPTRLAQAIGNLLHNAGKFTVHGGQVWLTAELDAAQNQAVIRVRDTGVGIEASQLRRIFEMFVQADSSLERTESGLGIGLSLTQSLVDLHGGKLEVQSPGRGQGSEFIIRLPLAVKPILSIDASSRQHSTLETQARRIMVVDDNQDSALSLSMLLEISGHETAVAHDGIEALRVAEDFLPDVMLLDIGMPKLNGYDAARRIRQQPWGKEMILVALTGWGKDGDRQKSEDAGFDMHLVKPVELETLIELFSGIEKKGS
jgi:signal transduction histidine kinase/ActR/RegA family two-component response regulator